MLPLVVPLVPTVKTEDVGAVSFQTAVAVADASVVSNLKYLVAPKED